MSDESRLEITRKEGGSSLTLSKSSSGLIARGRRDAVLLAVPCNKCHQRKEIVFAGGVCAGCGDALDDSWGAYTETDWVLVAFRGPEPEGSEWSRSHCLSCVAEAVDANDISRELLEDTVNKELINSTENRRGGWPFLYVYTGTTYAEMKVHWAKCSPPESLCIGPLTIDEFVENSRDTDDRVYVCPWPYGREGFQDAFPYIRPAIPREIELSETHRLAEEGDADAEFSLGLAYDNGWGIRREASEAEKWYRKAADQGHAQAQADLAILLFSADDPQSQAESVRLWHRAAEQGLAEAQYWLGAAYDNSDGVPQDYAEACRWYRKAAEQGVAAAQFDLGQNYVHGRGVPQDYVAAHMWFNLAAANGGHQLRWTISPDSKEQWAKARDEVASKMTPGQIAEAQRLAREWKPKPEDRA